MSRGNAEEVLGVNSRAELAQAEAAMQQRLRGKAMAEGATLVAPETVFLSHDTKIGKDVLIEPNVVIGPASSSRTARPSVASPISSSAHIGPKARGRPVRAAEARRQPRQAPRSAISSRSSSPRSPRAPRSTISPISAMRASARAPISAPAPSPATMTASPSTAPRSAPAPSSARTHRSSPRSRSATAPMSARAASSPRTLPRTRLRLPAPRRRSGQAGRPVSANGATGNKELQHMNCRRFGHLDR